MFLFEAEQMKAVSIMTIMFNLTRLGISHIAVAV